MPYVMPYVKFPLILSLVKILFMDKSSTPPCIFLLDQLLNIYHSECLKNKKACHICVYYCTLKKINMGNKITLGPGLNRIGLLTLVQQ